jgi:hypothetical protein
MAQDLQIGRWLQAMTEGIRLNGDLLAVIMPRVAPEAVAVAAAAQGLVQAMEDEDWVVRFEGSGSDLIVEDGEGNVTHWFKFRLLWSKASAEAEASIAADLEKLGKACQGGGTNGYVVAFAQTLEACRLGCEERLTRGTLDELTTGAAQRLNATAGSAPPFLGSVVTIQGCGALGHARLVAWKA